MKEKCYDLIARTSIELGLRTDGKTMAALAKILAADLQTENRFKMLSFDQIDEAFRQGVRFGKDDPFLNIRTFYKWIISHKKIINDATYQVRTMGKDPKEVPFYKSQKLLE
tara:strand:- start:18483 stop:18815 length:333 start_codon:yes stop_codon:yes gene_type:complete